jgi:predicted RNA-binding protein YlqC (UPF0109 family)
MPSATTPPENPGRSPQLDYVDHTEALTPRELYEEFLLALVDPKNRACVSVGEERRQDEIILTAHCHQEDVGKIVGKKGSCLEECTKLLNRTTGRDHLKVRLVVPR